ncbi:N-acetylmannosamine-6-phosphate 2-epimerase [Brachyspira pilosicoli]|uniref:Putative N-acetylmannosamine-6-phosphate 2-epimerase n=2 Tax=Brachyspira pilosicoli TaxID=52584 RepID=D8IG46_BRAP9|nr:N-acetylmannosamine-6-phosphate 2-epimerase [Brachyspira pilosicoli]ADK32110.1 N-acetylmannosamine-6-phosphate 2-epimerase [Brachyspira pilosicoli 95/1000]AFR71022.1 N-acetylmannosamine-6-phosphate 2-epimerase [Brachyspira pilosicoli B2904]MBW5399159.1 N-acetylmannosamine-6-phosphate 2-epimerase [Brachyspira pilosicoli]WIH84353.1 N-acetylmannosamine-6-phosphate 2-epimerase [Brachyspira pilosicoli]
MNEVFKKIKSKLIVSCQALEDEPLFSSFIMGRMALAATQAGAGGIRANTVVDIQEIKKNTNLPIIGIIKRNYGDCNVYITPTMKEIDELCAEGVDIIAIDATKRERPDKVQLKDFVKAIKEKYPNQIIMGDISDVSEAIYAEEIGIDIVGTTLCGYTDYTKGNEPLVTLEQVLKSVKIPVIGEGNLDTPEKAKNGIEMGALAVVVGGAITRPKQIAEKFVKAIETLQ